MGQKGAVGGDELDAFGRKSRHILSWKRGLLRRLKRQFAKRQRKAARRITTDG